MNSQPSSVSTRSMVVVGGGAPPTTIRTPARTDALDAALRIVFTTVGAPPMNVTP